MKGVVDFVIQEIGGDEGDRWRCRRLFYVVPLKTQNMCCRMNLCMSHAFLTQVNTSAFEHSAAGLSVNFKLLHALIPFAS